jgi:glycosyltransferase involved in cell wall biosynthesis
MDTGPKTAERLDEIDTMSVVKQTGYRPDRKIWQLLNRLLRQKRLTGISQGKCLIEKAKDLYCFPRLFTAEFVPNPVLIPQLTDDEIKNKKDYVIALGRLDSVKRPWITGEVAKALPQYDFFFLGQFHDDRMKEIMEPYRSLHNCHFIGHIEGIEKDRLLREAKIIINTSIHEAVPVSFLEALSYGMLIVSNRNPDDLTAHFGCYTGQINGDGFDNESIAPFIKGIQNIMDNDTLRIEKAKQSIEYIKTYHSIERFTKTFRNLLFDNTRLSTK